jgi:hypothetical protein
MANPDLDATSKQTAVNRQREALRNAMSIIGVTSNIPNLSNLITFT